LTGRGERVRASGPVEREVRLPLLFGTSASKLCASGCDISTRDRVLAYATMRRVNYAPLLR